MGTVLLGSQTFGEPPVGYAVYGYYPGGPLSHGNHPLKASKGRHPSLRELVASRGSWDFFCAVSSLDANGVVTMKLSWTEGRATVGTDPSADPEAETKGARRCRASFCLGPCLAHWRHCFGAAAAQHDATRRAGPAARADQEPKSSPSDRHQSDKSIVPFVRVLRYLEVCPSRLSRWCSRFVSAGPIEVDLFMATAPQHIPS
jgi:hypothetical protein